MRLTTQKLKKIIREELVSEIGEGSAGSYHYDVGEETVERWDDGDLRYMYLSYYFTTEGGYNYIVWIETIDKLPEGYVEVAYKVMNKKPDFITDEGKLLKVVNTVVQIAKEAYEKYGNIIKGFAFSGMDKSGGNFSPDTQRSKIYRNFVERQFPQAKVRNKGTFIFVEID